MRLGVSACVLSLAVAIGPVSAADQKAQNGQSSQSDKAAAAPSGGHNFTTDTSQRRDKSRDFEGAKQRNSHR